MSTKVSLLVVTGLAGFAALATPGAARAFSGAPGHADIQVKPVKKGGCVTGCTISFKLRNTGSSTYATAKHARVGLYRAGVVDKIGGEDGDRNSTYDEGPTAKFFKFKDIPVATQNTVYDGDIEIDYEKDGVKPGDVITVVSAWKYSPSGAPHVYGAVTQRDTANNVKVP